MQQDTASTFLWKSKSKPRQPTVTYTSVQTSKQEACGKLSSADLASVYRIVLIFPGSNLFANCRFLKFR